VIIDLSRACIAYISSVLLVFGLAVPSLAVEVHLPIRTVVLTDASFPAAGIEPDAFYDDFYLPVINSDGLVAFPGEYRATGTPFFRGEAVWAEADSVNAGLRLVVREAGVSPDPGNDVQFLFPGHPVLSDSGLVSFFAVQVDPVEGQSRAYFSETAGSLGSPIPVAREGQTAPGLEPGFVFTSLSSELWRSNRNGQIAFHASYENPGDANSRGQGIWSGSAASAGEPRLIAQTGAQAHGLPDGFVYFGFVDVPALNDDGEAAYIGRITGPGILGSSHTGVWSESSGEIGSPGLVVQTGERAPGTEANFLSFRFVEMNNAGQISVFGNLSGPTVNRGNAIGIWSTAAGVNGEIGLVAREGDQAPGTEEGVVFGGQFFGGLRQPALNDAGQTAFIGSLIGPGIDSTNDGGIWSEAFGASGNPGLVVREGDQVPDLPGLTFSEFLLPSFNNVGQVAFRGFISGPGVGLSNDEGIWVATPAGGLQLVVREGDLFDVSDDPTVPDLRIVEGIRVKTSYQIQDGPGAALNDLGQLTFRLEFTDNSEGIFVAYIPVPEPAAFAVLGLLFAGRLFNRP
jgi:hypothetical protein